MLFYLETNSKSGKFYLIATMKYTWCAYLSPPLTGINHYNLQKSLTSTLTLFIYNFISCFDDHVNYTLLHSSQIWVPVYISSLSYYISCVTSVTQKFKDESTSEVPRDRFFFLFAWRLEKPFRNYCIQKTKMSRSINDTFAGWSQSTVTMVNLIVKLHTNLATWSVL